MKALLPYLFITVLASAGWTSLSFSSASQSSFLMTAEIQRSLRMLRSLCSSSPVDAELLSIAAATSEASRAFDLKEELLLSMLATESRCSVGARSHKGAIGLMQIMPATARMLGVENPELARANVFGGAKYLSSLLRTFKGNERAAIAAYNAGPSAVRKHGGKVPPFRETKQYVAKVLAGVETLKKQGKLGEA